MDSDNSDSVSVSLVLVEEANVNQDRCQQILECKRKIEYWKAKLEVLEEEQTTCIKLARLRVDAVDTWRRLSREEQHEKKFILAALESEELPSALDDFSNGGFPPSIRMDKDILLARVARHDFSAKYEEERLFVPPNLRGDKEVILKIIPKHCAVVESMACTLRDDNEIFQSVLACSSLPSHILQHFSERIRSDRRLMLDLCAHRDGLSSMCFVNQELRNDKQFMLQAIHVSHNHQHSPNTSNLVDSSCNETHEILRYSSHRLQDDIDVVLAAVKKCGMNLKYASYNLRRDMAVVSEATRQNSTAFRYCLPGDAKDKLLRDRNFVVDKLLKNAPANVVRLCIEQFKTDRAVLLHALESGMDWSLVPDNMQEDQTFILDALRRNPSLYMQLPETVRSDYKIAREVIELDEVIDDVVLEATECCPELLNNRDAMLVIAKAWWTDVLQETLKFSPSEILGDKEIMLEAVKNDPTAYEFCSDELLKDRDIVMAAVEGAPLNLYLTDDSFQLENPDVVVCAINNSFEGDLESIFFDITSELWTNRDVAMAWLSKGGGWLQEFPKEFREEEEFALAVAKEDWENFNEVSSSLRGDKEFMLKAVALEGRVFGDAEGDLRHDFDLALLAFSQDQRALELYSDGKDFEFMVSFTETVRRKLDEYDTFMNVVVSNILRPIDHASCPLIFLNQGSETLKIHTAMISSYLGLPKEEEVARLQKVSNNLLLWGF